MSNKLLNKLIPLKQWRIPVLILLGITIGLLLMILKVSNAVSYMSDDPAACMNCHVMTPQFATWQKSSHKNVATCNDCHVPHNNIIRTYFFKASDGLRHATMFTFRLEPEVIRIHKAGQTVVQENCIRCHNNLLSQVAAIEYTAVKAIHGEGRLCWDCHRETPHGKVNSLSSVPFARVPELTPVMPEWISKYLDKSEK